MLALIASAGAGATPADCALPHPASFADPMAAQAYVEVARRHEQEGDLSLAERAFRSAVESDPGNEPARQGYQQTCGLRRRDEVISAAEAKAEAGDCAAALALLEAEPGALDDPEAALIGGGCAHALGNEKKAAALLETARQSPAQADVAAAMLALVHLGQGNPALSRAELSSALHSGDPVVRDAAEQLATAAARQGRLLAEARFSAGYDSNVELAPGTGFSPSDRGDAVGRVKASLLGRPLGDSGPFFGAEALYEAHPRLHSLDLGVARLYAGGRFAREQGSLAAGYTLDGVLLGGAPYQLVHGPFADLVVEGGRFFVGASWSAEVQNFVDPVYADYSGLTHAGVARVGATIGPAEFAVRYALGRDLARATELSWLEHGPELSAAIAPWNGLWLKLAYAHHLRSYDARDPALGVTRETSWDRAVATGEFDLSAAFAVFARLEAEIATSNVPELSWQRFTGVAGVRWRRGFF